MFQINFGKTGTGVSGFTRILQGNAKQCVEASGTVRHLLPYEKQTEAPDKSQRRLIPFYDDVTSIGGAGKQVADVEQPVQPAEWIDAGDWFHEATAAIRHYGDSMIEYPSGSILALKKVEDLRLIIPGRNYVVETTEFRVTKQLQPQQERQLIMAYSTNRETYPDGSLINAPFAIPLETVRTIWQVLGCVIKEYSGGAVRIIK